MKVIKYGGHAIPKPGSKDAVIALISEKFLNGQRLVLVHGGGPQIDSELALHSLPKEMISGYRITTSQVFEVVQKVLSGQVLRTLVNQFISHGVNAVGLSASDGCIIRAVKMSPLVNGIPTDIGLVGDIAQVNPDLLLSLLAQGYFPIISPVAVDSSGQGFNINADLAAGAIGGALGADEVIFMTDVAGIYRDFPKPDSLISEIDCAGLQEIQDSFVEGMVPKVKAAICALQAGAKKVRIIDGRDLTTVEQALLGVGGTVVLP
jgi:acetylglutamate kinase